MKLECGCDEAGRGAGAGEIYVSAVILNPARPIEGLADSKKLTPKKRESLYRKITLHALSWSIDKATLEEIERLNVLHATLLAMKRAVHRLKMKPRIVFVDGPHAPALTIPVQTVIKGDDKVPSISAASILAKVERDRSMVHYHTLYPEYGFNLHKGYLTKAHMRALHAYGPCPIHRKTYAPIRNMNLFI